jgi:hypothetical protein
VVYRLKTGNPPEGEVDVATAAVDNGSRAAAGLERRHRELPEMGGPPVVRLVDGDVPGRHPPQHLKHLADRGVVLGSRIRTSLDRIGGSGKPHARSKWSDVRRQRLPQKAHAVEDIGDRTRVQRGKSAPQLLQIEGGQVALRLRPLDFTSFFFAKDMVAANAWVLAELGRRDLVPAI